MAWSLAAGGGRGRQPSPGLALRATQQTPSLCREPAGPRPADRYRPRRPPQQWPLSLFPFCFCFCPSQARPPVHAWLTSLSFPATALARLQAESTHPGFSPETACCLYATDEFSFGLLPLGKKKKSSCAPFTMARLSTFALLGALLCWAAASASAQITDQTPNLVWEQDGPMVDSRCTAIFFTTLFLSAWLVWCLCFAAGGVRRGLGRAVLGGWFRGASPGSELGRVAGPKGAHKGGHVRSGPFFVPGKHMFVLRVLRTGPAATARFERFLRTVHWLSARFLGR